MGNSFAEKIRRLEEKKARALESAKREAARIEEAKQKLTEPLVRRFSGWTKSAIDGVLGNNLKQLDALSDRVTREALERVVTDYLESVLASAEAPAVEAASAAANEPKISRLEDQPQATTV
jgi:hypothetical protein